MKKIGTEHQGRDRTRVGKRASSEDRSRVQTGLFLLFVWECAQLGVTERGLPDVRGWVVTRDGCSPW